MDERTYPTVGDLETVQRVVADHHDGTTTGVRDRGGLDAAVGTALSRAAPEADRPRARVAWELCRLVCANHPFVDGNKRTALRAASLTYELDGCRLHYGADLESLVRVVALDAGMVDPERAAAYIDSRAAPADHGTGWSPDPPPDPAERERFVTVATGRDIQEHRDIYDRLADS